MPGSVAVGTLQPPFLDVLRESVHAALHYLAPRKACRGTENRSPIVVVVVVFTSFFFLILKVFFGVYFEILRRMGKNED